MIPSKQPATTESILVTGGAGFIGANLVRTALETTNYRIVALDRKSHADSLVALQGSSENPRLAYVHGNIGDSGMAAIFLEHRPTYVVHLAAEMGAECTYEPHPFFYTNVIGTLNVLEAAKGYFTSLSEPERLRFRFIHISSDDVYGSTGTAGSVTERSFLEPSSLYGASKASAEQIARVYWKTCGLPVIVLNPSNNFGPCQPLDKLIPLMIMNAVAGKPLSIVGDGGDMRDWIFVEDHCLAILKVLEEGVPGEKYNVSGGNDLRIVDVVDRVCELVEKVLPASKNRMLVRRDIKSYKDLKTFSKDARRERRALASSRLRKELEWRPKYTFETGLIRTIDWYLKNMPWWGRTSAAPAVPNRGRCPA